MDALWVISTNEAGYNVQNRDSKIIQISEDDRTIIVLCCALLHLFTFSLVLCQNNRISFKCFLCDECRPISGLLKIFCKSTIFHKFHVKGICPFKTNSRPYKMSCAVTMFRSPFNAVQRAFKGHAYSIFSSRKKGPCEVKEGILRSNQAYREKIDKWSKRKDTCIFTRINNPSKWLSRSPR